MTEENDRGVDPPEQTVDRIEKDYGFTNVTRALDVYGWGAPGIDGHRRIFVPSKPVTPPTQDEIDRAKAEYYARQK